MSKESAVRAIVTDIEGTTSSIDFVHQTLFPYARKHLRVWLRENAGQSQVQQLINDVEAIEHEDLSIDEAADVLERWIDQDQKHTPLKALQGMIWKQGYAAGELKGHVYEDTPDALREWHQQGLSLYVYSSGSVEAQKLIFGHTDYGDLTPLFSGYFDTRVGGKREAASYRAILSQIQLPGEQVMFLSDVGEELDAARIAGMQTVQLIRDEKTVVAAHHRGVTDLFQAL
tara:strand:+ start:21289 stop:21975 length:687 start_codon:yes stop_codon:yes gene_type:complete